MEHREKFIKLLDEASRNDSRSKIFDDFLKIAATSLANIDKNNPAYPSREKLFLETVGRYDKKIQSLFADMTAELALALEDCIGQKVLRDKILKLDYVISCNDGHKPHYQDVLGEIFHEFNLNDQKGGQVFTPQHIGNLMSAVSLTEELVKSEIKRNGFIKIREPCCGSGALTLGALNRLLEFGISPNYHSLVIASDIDERCVLMTYIQLSLYGIPAIIFQQNAITDEIYSDKWLTPMFNEIFTRKE